MPRDRCKEEARLVRWIYQSLGMDSSTQAAGSSHQRLCVLESSSEVVLVGRSHRAYIDFTAGFSIAVRQDNPRVLAESVCRLRTGSNIFSIRSLCVLRRQNNPLVHFQPQFDL